MKKGYDGMKKIYFVYICLIFLMIVVLLVPLTSSILKNSASSTGSATTAEWNVSLTRLSETNNVTLISGTNTQTYSLKVSSESEVDVTYAIEISNVPSGVKIKLDQRQIYETPDVNNKITFSNAGSILYSSQGGENTHILTFTSDPGTQVASNIELGVKVIAQQVL